MIQKPRQLHSSAWICCMLGSLFLGTGSVLALEQEQAPKSFRLEEKALKDLPSQPATEKGQFALSINPDKWRHAETDNFIIHYRRITEAQRVVKEIEYYLWYISKFLGASKEQYQQKSHVFIFKDLEEWKMFRSKVSKNSWGASFASGGELFLNFRDEAPGSNVAHRLAHETTHVVVMRLYRGDHWPIWLNEGFAEYMEGASVAARKGIYSGHYDKTLRRADMPLEELFSLTQYPEKQEEVGPLYQTSERLIRFLINELPKERFPKFIDAILSGQTFEPALLSVYGDQIKSMDNFQRRFERFGK